MEKQGENFNVNPHDVERAERDSIKLLYKCFCNNLQLGQWEVARSCIQQLKEKEAIIGCDINDILTEIAENPYQQSLGSSTLNSPSQLSWLCLLECQTLSDKSSEEKIFWLTKLTKDADFRLLLAEIPPDTDSNIIKELYGYLQTTSNQRPISLDLSSKVTHTLSKNTLNFLKQLLLSKTDLGHLIINHLMIRDVQEKPSSNTDFSHSDSQGGGDNISRNNETLQSLYVQCINTVLDHIEKTTIKQQEKLEQFSKLLGYYDPQPYWNYLQLRQLFTRLLETSGQDGSLLSKDTIVSLLIGRKNNYLIDEFCKLEYELLSTKACEMNNRETAGISEEEKCIIYVFCEQDRENRWRNMFLLSTKKQKHFLEMILNTALNLVKAEKFSLLEKLLSHEELKPLKPMVLLIGWSYCSSCNIARQLLSILWNEQDECNHTALTASCKRLSYQIDLIQWCLEKAKPLIESSSNTSMASHERATNMLQNLSTHSVLFVLHQSTRISALNPDEVLRLLQNTSHTENPDNRKKSVRFQDEKTKTSSHFDNEPISIEQQCDISIFRSFCAIKNTMDILAFCSEHFEHELMNPVCIKNSLRPKHLMRAFSMEEGVSSSSDGEDWLSSSQTGQSLMSDNVNNFEKLYEMNVTKKLIATKIHLKQLHPLQLRVETLENILSLLFVTHEDFNSDYVQDPDSGDEEGEVGSKRNSAENMSLNSEEETPQIGKKMNFSRSSQKANPDPASSSQSFPVSVGYDEPFEDTVQTSQSLQQSVSIPQNQLADAKTTPTKKLSLTLTSLRKMSSLNKSSEISSSLTSGNMKIGFLANEYIVRDILAMLKDSLLDLNTVRFKLSGKDGDTKDGKTNDLMIDSELEKLLVQHVKSSITSETLQQRITRLTQLIHEAQWRFQLVCHEQVPRQPGMLLQRPVICTDNETSILLSNSSLRRSRSKSPRKEVVGTISSDDDNMFGAASVKKSGRNSVDLRRGQPASLSSVASRTPGIIPLMLSSPDSLLSMCLSKGNFGQATQVIKLFKLEKKDDTAEVSFSDSFKKAASSLSSLVENPGKAAPSSSRPGKLSIKALGSVAAAGMASATLTNITDDLLSVRDIPQLPKPNLPKSNKLLIFFTEVHVSIAVLVDLLLTSCKTWELCNKMLDVIKSKMNVKNISDLNNDHQNMETMVIGCQTYLSELQKLLELSVDPDTHMTYAESENAKRTSVPRQSFVNMLLSATTPVTAERLKNFIGVKEEIKHLLNRVVGVLSEMKQSGSEDVSFDDSLPSPSSPAPSPSPSPSPHLSPLGSISSRSSFRIEPPVMHTVMKQLIACMEKYVPTGGMVRMLKRSRNSIVTPNRNYLLSLYDHVKELAFLVAQSESKAQESIVLPKNYFRMLQEGPILILGRLMFNKKLQPAKLEKVAAKLSLNLTHIIVHSCCPRIPSKQVLPIITDKTRQGYKEERTKIIYNDGEPTKMLSGLNAEKLIQEILSNIIFKMKETAIKCNAKEIFDVTCAKLFVQEDGYDELFSTTRDLQLADLNELKSSDEKTSFFINLHNLMTIHVHLDYIEYRLHKQKMLENEESRPVSFSDGEVFTMSSLDHLVHRQQFAYKVGQLGVVSLSDIQHFIYQQKCQPIFKANNIVVPRFGMSCHDPWNIYSPPIDDRFIFLQIDGCISSPFLQVVYSETLSNQLQITMKEYINQTVSVDVDKKQVTVSQYIMWYKESQSVDASNKSEYLVLKEVIDFILNYLDGTKRDMLQDLINMDINEDGSTENIDTAGRKELPFTVTVQPFNQEFTIVFTSSCLPSAETPVLPPCSKPKLVSRMESSIESLLERSGSYIENPSYLLTPTTLDYIKSDSLLVATMVSLVCADELDEIDQHFNDDYFRQESFPKNRTMSDISLVDIRSYRYQRLTDDFPVLQRHLLNYILPLAGADNPDISNSGDPILKFVTNDIDEKVKLCMFSLHNSVQFQDVVIEMILRFLQTDNYYSILTILRSIPEIVMIQKREWQILHDYVISCLAMKYCQSSDCDPKVIRLLRYFYCVNTQVRTILKVCNNLPLDMAIDLLELCLSQDISCELIPVVRNQLQVLTVYSKIIDSVRNLQFKLSMRTSEFFIVENKDILYHSALEPFTDWHYLVKCSCDSPQDVFAVLMKTGIYATAKEWARINNVPQKLKLDVEERYIVSLLSSETTDAVKAFQTLEDLKKESESTCLTMCENLLQKLPDHRHILFLTSYMLNQLGSVLQHNKQDVQLRHIGAKALQCLPSSLRGDYSNLITSPHLILEQLLMNMKADLAGQVFSEIKDDFAALNDEKLRLSTDQFNQMLTKYAKLGVEVTVVQYYPDRERSFSTESGELKREESDLQKSFMESVRLRRRGIELSVSPRGQSISSPAASPRRRSSLYLKPPVEGASSSSLNSNQGKFIMPPVPPPPEKWVKDESTSVCMVCNVERFSMFNRRHHCRRCGRVVCSACSTKRSEIQGVSARVCDDCYQQIFGQINAKPKEQEFYSHTPDKLSEASNSPQQAPYCSSYNSVTSPDKDGNTLNITVQGDSEWKLKTDENYNKLVRDEFYFEQAPSVSLSISILNQHSNGTECGHVLLKMCEDLSKFLQPIAPGVPNPEVDYSLIISMIKQLLFQAKMKFLKCGDNKNIGQCDMYQTRVDLLKILVEANYRNLPTIEELTKVDTVRRLRDKLISDERLSLAMEVSTKCGLDSSGVWAAWGMALLHCGNYTGAREKFTHCLKAPKDKNQTTVSSRLLLEVVDHLETLPATGATEIQMLLSSPASIKSLIKMPASVSVEESSMETIQFQECIYYLKTYGTYLELLHLLRRNGYWMKASEYIIQHKCISEVFIEGLLVPALNSGDLDKLLDQMVMLDKSLEKWNNYLTATCRYLLKQRLHHALYQIQIFMKDYLRAAMTCISHFYQQGCQSYLDLAKRIQYLFTAQQHMNAYLDPSKWGSVKHPFNSSTKKGVDWRGSPPENPVRLSLTTEEVNKHVRTIALQIEITQYLDQCLKKMEGDAATLAASYVVESQKSNLPTLFGNSKMRTELVTMILQSGDMIKSGFDLSVRIIKECRLSSTAIFTQTARELAKRQHYGSIRELLDTLNISGISLTDDDSDEIIRAGLLVLADNQEEAKETENLIKLLKKDTNKINAYILCGKLRSAYLLAVKSDRVEDVQRIAGAAQRTGQAAVKNICTKWLQQRQK
ncbi:hypothetical protein SNE40_009062 [Patella caerulea]|uniref:FYVE-type domain-containing protein n=1 Tax=Patella caerulea TaxID=87958 RepID=A0AAN8JSR3_PATCE